MTPTISGRERGDAFDGVNNFRDFGGWPTQGGRRVVTGRLFRSAHHARASAADGDTLARLGIRTIVDLRGTGERLRQPSRWLTSLTPDIIIAANECDDADADATAFPPHVAALVNGARDPDAVHRFLIGLYAEIPYDRMYVDLFRRYFATLADGDAAVLIHCSAGKDRTGILAALTHALLRVDPAAVMEDYLLTNTASNIAERLPRLGTRLTAVYGISIGDAALLTLLRVEPAYLEAMFTSVRARSGTIEGYFKTVLGIDVPQRDRIVAHCIN